VVTKNRDRLLAGEIATPFFQAVRGQPEVGALLSDDHFTVDGTLIEAFASMTSFRPKARGRRRATGGRAAGGSGRVDVRPDRRRLQPGSDCPSCWWRPDHGRSPPERPRVGAGGGPQRLVTPAAAMSNITKEGNDPLSKFISAPS
jgi:hypothetical protein